MYSLLTVSNTEPKNVTLHMVSPTKANLNNQAGKKHDKRCKCTIQFTQFYELIMHDDIHDDECSKYNGKDIVEIGHLKSKHYGEEHLYILYIGKNYYSLKKLENYRFNANEDNMYAMMFCYDFFDWGNHEPKKHEILIIQNNHNCILEVFRDISIHIDYYKNNPTHGMISTIHLNTFPTCLNDFHKDGVISPNEWSVKVIRDEQSLNNCLKKYKEFGDTVINEIENMMKKQTGSMEIIYDSDDTCVIHYNKK